MPPALKLLVAELPSNVLAISVRIALPGAPSFKMPPTLKVAVAELLLMVLLVTARVALPERPSLKMAPALKRLVPAELPARVLALRVSVAWPLLPPSL